MTRLFTGVLAVVLAAPHAGAEVPDGAHPLDAVERARRHAIERRGPAVDFFEGALLGNGAMGAVVTTRPDAVVIHFGHNEVWDIRAEEVPSSAVGQFADLWKRFQNGDRSWVEGYNKRAGKPDSNKYPRPWPCGALLLGFDRRDGEVLGHTVHLDSGVVIDIAAAGIAAKAAQGLFDVFQPQLQATEPIQVWRDAKLPYFAADWNDIGYTGNAH